jgi:excinuclease ABC subunit C
MEKEMENLSAELNFEQAKLVRDKYLILKDYTSQQKIVTADLADRDIIGVSRIDDDACSLVFTVRDGKLTGKRHYIITDAGGLTDSEIIQSTIEKWYLENEFIPKEIFLPAEPGQPEFILDWLKKKRGKSLEILVPKLGDKKKLVTLAATNAEYMLRDYHLSIAKREQTTAKAVLALQKDLNLSKPPVRIECFDNSHIQGSELVSSVVVFVDGKPKKQEYRRFRIKTVSGNDDFAAMQEVVRRRYTRVLGENSPLPDLIIIDGGKGQLSHAFDVLKELKIETQVPVISLAKRIDEVFFSDKQESLYLPRTSAGLRLIQQLRNEAHRFAITYHRKLREKRTLKTELTEIPGIGEKLSKKLLIEFGSVENIRTASPDSLEKTIGKRAAAKVAEYFKEK